ncbi:type II CRISPR-associated endonuclease Cas1 [Fulvivirga sp.]|uniref:type II CRISPR-associated endonuclease Cas1 n=1 Tax=Fulvivirga sp. TaxID=1931237 RepID=UPI0032ED981F
MIKRTLLFSNPAYLSTKNEQLVVSYPNNEQQEKIVPIEDIGIVVIEHRQVTLTNALINKLTIQKTALVCCDERHMPTGLLLPLSGHTEYTERLKYQLDASQPLKKNLWAQTVSAKIINQAGLLAERGGEVENMMYMAKNVQSGDKGNHEARAAAYYWQRLFDMDDYNRDPFGMPPNNLLNYGYAILRAITARSLVSSGLLPAMGIWHRNKYNAYCLADDIMEPYRPYVDLVVCHLTENLDDISELTTEIKSELLQVAAIDVVLEGKTSPLMVAMSRTTNSLFDCFAGNSRKILYPVYGS